jgi:hypothetical protein
MPHRKVQIWRATKLDVINAAQAYLAKCANLQGT